MVSRHRMTSGLGIYMLVALSKGLWIGRLDGLAFWFADIFCFVMVPLLLITALRLPILPAFSTTSPTPGHLRRVEGIGSLLFFTAICLLIISVALVIGRKLGLVTGRAMPAVLTQVLSYKSHVPDSGMARAICAIYLALTAGVVEEYFFRGIAKPVIDKVTHSLFLYVFVSSALFASVHWASGLANVVQAFICGLALGSLYVWIRHLTPLMIAHSLVDWYYFA